MKNKIISTIHSINQDSFGFIWITSPYGLIRFDGKEYIFFEHQLNNPNSLSTNILFSTFEDSKKRLWITSDKGLLLFNRKTGDFTRFLHDQINENSLPGNNLRAICEDHSGNLWIGTKNSGLCRFNPDTNLYTRFKHDPGNKSSLGGNSVWALNHSGDNKLWIGVHDSGLDCFDFNTNTWIHHKIQEGVKNRLNSNIWWLVDSKEKLWIGTNGGGLNWLDKKTQMFYKTHLRPKPWTFGDDFKIMAVFQDEKESIWIGSQEKGGLFKYNPISKILLNYKNDPKNPNSIPNNDIFSIYSDREKLLWIGTDHGIGLYNRNKRNFKEIGSQILKTRFDFNLSAIFEDSQGWLWLGTETQGLKIFDTRTKKFIYNLLPLKIQLLFSKVLQIKICEDKFQNIWFATNHGLVQFVRKTNKIFTYQKGGVGDFTFPTNYITHVLSTNDGFLWIGARVQINPFICRLNIKTGKIDTFSDNLPSKIQQITQLEEDSDKNIWIGTKWNGIGRLNPGQSTWVFYNDASKIASLNIQALKFHQGKMWVGTNNGLSIYDLSSEKWTNLKDLKNLLKSGVTGLCADQPGNLWILTTDHMVKLNPINNHFNQFQINKEGFNNTGFKPGVFFLNSENILYLGGGSGLDCFRTDNIKINQYHPPVFLNFLQFGNDRKKNYFYDLKDIKISDQDLPLKMNVLVLSYSQPDNNYIKVKNNGKLLQEIRGNDFEFKKFSKKENKIQVFGANHDRVWNPVPKEFTIYYSSSSKVLRYFIFIIIGLSFMFILFIMLQKKSSKKIPDISQKDLCPFFEQFKLSKREREVFKLVIEGKSNKQIEDQLFISIYTVRAHIYNIFRKIKVKNRLELINKTFKYLRK